MEAGFESTLLDLTVFHDSAKRRIVQPWEGSKAVELGVNSRRHNGAVLIVPYLPSWPPCLCLVRVALTTLLRLLS